jgi:CrcB protein
MTAALAIAAGGAVGSLLRWLVSRWLTSPTDRFPVATLAINVAGSFLLGVLLRGWPVSEPQPALRLALTVGLCGGFTTFSTLSAECFALLEQGAWARAATYVVASLAGGLAATALGWFLGARFGPAAP